MIKEFINLANHLDSKGLLKEARFELAITNVTIEP